MKEKETGEELIDIDEKGNPIEKKKRKKIKNQIHPTKLL